MPTSNNDFFVKNGLVVGASANVAGNTNVSGNLNVVNNINTTNTSATHVLQGNTNINPGTPAAGVTNPTQVGGDVTIDRVNGKISIGIPNITNNTYDQLFDDKVKIHGSSNTTLDVRVGRNLSVGGNVAITANLNVANSAYIGTTLTVAGNVSVRGLTTNGDIVLPVGAKVDGVDVSELQLQVSTVPQLRVYDVNSVQIFP